MTPRFSLQRVLELKERREQAVAARLAEARTAAETARQAEAALESLRGQGEAGRPGVPGTTANIGQLQNAGFILEQLEARLTEARSQVRDADAKVNECMTEFTLATRERQMLDRLKERKLEAALAAEADADRKQMDAIAISRFVRRTHANEGGGA